MRTSTEGKRRGPWPLLALGLLVLGALGAARTLQISLARPLPSQLMLDRHGEYLGEVNATDEELGYWPLPATVPERLLSATLETEDRHFFAHRGVHWPSVARALWQNLKNLRVVSGASTLPMQVARMQSPASRTPLRKAKEALEALLLVHLYGHDALLRQYLTLAPYGNRVHGAARAARLYFDKPLEDLSWKQAAFLAGLPQLPGRMNPYQPEGLRRSLRRSERILRALHVRGTLSDTELAQALESGLSLIPLPHRRPEALHAVLQWSDEARQAPSATPADPIRATTLDLSLQATVAGILNDNLMGLRFHDASATAGLLVDTATGDVLAAVGSQDFFSSQGHGSINYTRVKRSPGSALKPFIYGLGLESGRITAASELADTPLEIALEGGKTFTPENANRVFLGPLLAREALGNSRNIPAMRVLAELGVEPTLRLLERGGVHDVSFQPGRYGLSLATGSLPVTLEELTELYTALAHAGVTLPLRHFADRPKVAGERLFSRETAQLLSNILSDAQARRPSFPANGFMDFPYAVAIKTGTSSGFRDAWAAAYSDRLLVVVWVGNHDARRMNDVTGYGGAAGAVRAILDAVTPRYQSHREVTVSFPPPAGYLPVRVCALSGRRAGPDCPHARTEYFRPGTEPVDECPYHVHRDLDVRNGLLATPQCPRAYVRSRAVVSLPDGYTTWAQRQHLDLAPTRTSPLCGPEPVAAPHVAVKEPRDNLHLLFDPEAPRHAGNLLLVASVRPSTERVVWIVDGVPIGTVGYPHELRWSPTPGPHVIRAALERVAQKSPPVHVFVED